MEIILIRHGESEHNSGTTQVRDCWITPLGRQQAARAAEALRGETIDRFYCSLQRRGMETASIIAGELDLDIRLCPDITEHGFSGEEPGLSRSEIARRFPRVVLTDDIDEGGCLRRWGDETVEALSARTRQTAEWFRALAVDEELVTLACVIHGTSGSWILRHLLGADFDGRVRFAHRNCGITRLRIEPNGTVIVRAINETGHLAGLPLTTPAPEAASP